MAGHWKELSEPARAALLNYKQADMEGTMVLTSRQAIHEVADALDQALAREADLLKVVIEFAVLGHGKCTIGKPLADMARAAIARATEGQ